MLAHETGRKSKGATELRATLGSWRDASAQGWGCSFRAASIFENECRRECKRIDALYVSKDFSTLQ
jgi:hypothetical protein